MTITGYSNVGTILLWIGAFVAVSSLCLFYFASKGISVSQLDELNLHDSHYVLLNWKARFILLVPLVAGLLLIFSGRFIRSQAAIVEAKVQGIEEVE